MDKSKYLRTIAIFELIIFLGGTIAYVINMVNQFIGLKDIPDSAAKGWTMFSLIIGLILILFFGPAMYVLFSSVADLLDSRETYKAPSVKPSYSSTKSHVNYSPTTKSTINKKPIVSSKFKIGQKVTTNKELEDRDGNQIPKGCSGVVLEIEPNGLVKVDFEPLSSGIEVIMRVEENNLK